MPGIYELADEEKVLLYIGQSARDVPNRIRQHLAKRGNLRDQVCFWRYVYSRVPQADEAKHIKAYIVEFGELPSCNTATPKDSRCTPKVSGEKLWLTVDLAPASLLHLCAVRAQVAELVDAADSKSAGATCEGSSPSLGTTFSNSPSKLVKDDFF